MICESTKKYLLMRAKNENITLPENYEYVLNQYQKLAASFGSRLEFKKSYWLTSTKLNASAGQFKTSNIIATPEWAYQLVVNNTEELQNIFKITLGHELSHHEESILYIYRHGIFAIKFHAWVNEVRCDFGGAQKMANSSRKKLVASIDYKQSLVETDIEDFSHPSLTRRKYYAERYDFNEKLIRKIAEDIHYHNQKVIQKVCNYYPEIVLK